MADFVKSAGKVAVKEHDDDEEEENGVENEEHDEEDEEEGEEEEEQEEEDDEETTSAPSASKTIPKPTVEEEVFDVRNPRRVVYCPTCSMPPEYCEYGQTFDKCLPWIYANCPEVLSDKVLATMVGTVSIEEDEGDGKKKKERGGGAAAKKSKVLLEPKVIIARIQRQKKKYVTVVVGLDTVQDLKIKDATKVFGKKFSSGASVGDGATGQKEVTIQGDVMFDLPPLLMKEFKVPASAIYYLNDDKTLSAYA